MSFSISVGSATFGGAATVIPGTGPLDVPTGTDGTTVLGAVVTVAGPGGTTISGALAFGAAGRGGGSVAVGGGRTVAGWLGSTIGGRTVTNGLERPRAAGPVGRGGAKRRTRESTTAGPRAC